MAREKFYCFVNWTCRVGVSFPKEMPKLFNLEEGCFQLQVEGGIFIGGGKKRCWSGV